MGRARPVSGAPGFSLSASLAALAGFLLGALADGRVLRRRGTHRGRLPRVPLPWAMGLATLLLAVVAVLAFTLNRRDEEWPTHGT